MDSNPKLRIMLLLKAESERIMAASPRESVKDHDLLVLVGCAVGMCCLSAQTYHTDTEKVTIMDSGFQAINTLLADVLLDRIPEMGPLVVEAMQDKP